MISVAYSNAFRIVKPLNVAVNQFQFPIVILWCKLNSHEMSKDQKYWKSFDRSNISKHLLLHFSELNFCFASQLSVVVFLNIEKNEKGTIGPEC